MRVEIIAAMAHPIAEPFSGGLERHTWTLARGLARRGHEVTVWAGQGSVGDGFAVRSIAACSGELRLSESARNDVSMVPEQLLHAHHAYLGLMLTLRDRASDVVHNNSLHHLPVAMAPAVGAASTMTLHSPPTPWLESALRQRDVTVACAAVSHDTARRWRHATPSHVIHNGVDTDAWPFGAGGSGRAVWTGRIVPEKGPDLAIEAARRAGIPLDLAGPAPDQAHLESAVLSRLGPDDRYVGHLGGEALSDLVRSAEVQLVTPRWDEPYGLVVAEALSSGTPVAAFRRGGIPEVLDDRSGRVVEPDDVRALAAAVEECLALDRGACRARALTTASADRMVDDYERFFTEVAA